MEKINYQSSQQALKKILDLSLTNPNSNQSLIQKILQDKIMPSAAPEIFYNLSLDDNQSNQYGLPKFEPKTRKFESAQPNLISGLHHHHYKRPVKMSVLENGELGFTTNKNFYFEDPQFMDSLKCAHGNSQYCRNCVADAGRIDPNKNSGILNTSMGYNEGQCTGERLITDERLETNNDFFSGRTSQIEGIFRGSYEKTSKRYSKLVSEGSCKMLNNRD
jgi:hypothetical protein